MNLIHFIKILLRNIKYLLVIPLVMSSLVFVLTMNQNFEFTSRSTIFTGITSGQSIADMGNSRVDYFATQNAYNNLLGILRSHNVLEETSIRLLASHLILEQPKQGVISAKAFNELQEILPDEVKKLAVKDNLAQTAENLQAHLSQDKENFLYGLLNLDHPHYSLKALSNIKVLRMDASDIVEISYQTNDAGICYNTIVILTEVFFKKHSELKRTQTNAAVEYFEQQLQKSSNKLSKIEDHLLDFNTKNQIINYYEQTKHISSQQEKIEVQLQQIQLENDAAAAVLGKLEIEIENRFKINLKNISILKTREKLININDQLATIEISEKTEHIVQRNSFQLEKLKLESLLQMQLDSLQIYERNSEGIEIKTLLSDWLKTLIEYESAAARLKAMTQKKEDFIKLYQQYAPLGAQLKRIEREINVNEEEYLEILHHLGLARLKQQNAELAANMKILDQPTLPIDPIPTKRKVMVVAIGFMSFLLTALTLFVFELIDKRMKTIPRLKAQTQTETITAFCNSEKAKDIEYRKLEQLSTKLLAEHIFAVSDYPDKNSSIIQFISFWSGEGKSFVINCLKDMLKKISIEYTVVKFSDSDNHGVSDSDLLLPVEKLGGMQDIEEYLLAYHPERINGKKLVIVELPPLSASVVSPNLFNKAERNYLLVEACRIWSQADDFHLKNLKYHAGESLYSILTKNEAETMEELAGEIPKKRSKLHAYIKHKIFQRFFG